MPLFEYRCQACGRLFEVLAKNSSERAPKCIHCSSANVTKQMSAFAVSLGSDLGGECGSVAGGCSNCDLGGCPYSDDD